MRSKRKRKKELSPAQRVVAFVVLAVSLVIVASAVRDLAHRPDEEIRGDKRIMALAMCLNALGELGYYRWGRRTAA